MKSVPKYQIETSLTNPVRCVANTTRVTPKSYTEYTPLLGRRPLRKGSGINFGLLSLGILLFGGLTIGSYLLAKDNRPFPVTLVFDMVDRSMWGANEYPIGSLLTSSNVRNIFVMQTNSIECHNYNDCVAVIRNMQISASKTQNAGVPYNFLIGGDGETYEAHGWSEQCGFSYIPQNSSLSIGIVGTFNDHPPSKCQLTETLALISESLRRHKIIKNYRIYGVWNSSISSTDSQALLRQISNWNHWHSALNVI